MPRGFALPAGTQYPCAAVRYSVRRFFIEIYLPACLEKSKWGQTVGVAELPTMQRLFSFFFLKNGPRLLYRGGGRFFCAAQGPPGPPHAAPVLAGHKAQRRAFPSPAPKRGFPLCGGGRANRGQRRQERTWKQQLVPPKAARSFVPLKQTPYAGRTGRMGRKGAPRAKKENNRAAESPKGDLPCPGSAATARRSGKSPPAAAAMERGAALHLPPHRPGF